MVIQMPSIKSKILSAHLRSDCQKVLQESYLYYFIVTVDPDAYLESISIPTDFLVFESATAHFRSESREVSLEFNRSARIKGRGNAPPLLRVTYSPQNVAHCPTILLYCVINCPKSELPDLERPYLNVSKVMSPRVDIYLKLSTPSRIYFTLNYR